MVEPKWCLKCKKELNGGSPDLSIFGMGSGSGIYCKNSKCERYGLLTVLYLQEEKKAPKNAVSNNDLENTENK